MSRLTYKNGLWLPPEARDDRFRRPDEGYHLPIRILDELSVQPEDGELVHAMAEHPPDSKFREGDLVYLQRCPGSLRLKRELVPRFWKIRWVISTFTYEVNALMHSQQHGEVMGIDHAIALLDAQGGLNETRYRQPFIYAHGFPHGHYPDSAMWFAESCFRRLTLREKNEAWELLLDEAHAPFRGWDRRTYARPVILDVAPDRYRDGEALGAPLPSEEATYQTACLLGMEEMMVRPVDSFAIGDPRSVDPEHDCFVQHSDYT